jgi:LacI family transcriptional regulator
MNDMMAFGAMAAIQEAGLRIPEDIAVVGYDDIRLARFANPPLTTARAPEVELGRLGADMLMQLIKGKEPAARQVFLKSELVIRASCGMNNALSHDNTPQRNHHSEKVTKDAIIKGM